jgi:hypothetical protein
MMAALGFTGTLTPYEVCMMWEDTGFGTLFVLNWVSLSPSYRSLPLANRCIADTCHSPTPSSIHVPSTRAQALATSRQFINAIFIFDMGFNFFLPYREHVKQGSQLVKDHRKVTGAVRVSGGSRCRRRRAAATEHA